jgi:hypothetical protein
MEVGPLGKGKCLLSSGWLVLFKEMIVAVGFKENLTIDPDRPFCGNKHQDF